MKVITPDADKKLTQLSHQPFGGLASGAVRAMAAVVQIIANGILLIGSGFYHAFCKKADNNHWLHIANVGGDLARGFTQLTRAAIELAPLPTFVGLNKLERKTVLCHGGGYEVLTPFTLYSHDKKNYIRIAGEWKEMKFDNTCYSEKLGHVFSSFGIVHLVGDDSRIGLIL